MPDERDSEKFISNIADNTETSIDDINLSTDSKNKRNSTKQQHLDKLKTKTQIIYTVVAILATALISVYSYFAFRFVRDGINQSVEEFIKDYHQTFMLRWILSAIFTVAQVIMSLFMMCLLKVRFV